MHATHESPAAPGGLFAPAPPPKPAAEPPQPNRLDERSAHLIERRLDDLEETCSFSGDEMDKIWAGVYPEGAPPPSKEAEVVVGARVRDRVRHVLKLAGKSRERAVPLAEWQALCDEVFRVRQERDRVVVGERALEALGKMMRVCDLRRDLVLDLDRWVALLETILPERYLAPALLADAPCAAPPLSGERVREYQRRVYYQRCLWHPGDAGNFERDLSEEGAAEGGCETGCSEKPQKKKRHAPRPRTLGERVAAGLAEAPKDWFPGMWRLEDCFLQDEENYNPARYLLADKGDERGGEGKRAHREAS